MNDRETQDIADELMHSICNTVTSCVRQAMREYAVQVVPKECTVTLWASETAAYIGRDSWMSRDKALANVWRRTNEAHFCTVQDIWRAHGGCLPDGSATFEQVRRRLAHTFDPFPDVVTVEDVEAFRRRASTADILKLYKAKGQVFEESLAQEFAKTVFQPVALRNSSVVWSSLTKVAVPRFEAHARPDDEAIADPGPFQIVGQVDGVLCQPPFEDTIVEFKLRCTRIPDDIPFRDFAQVQTYLHVRRAKEAMYVQGLLGSRELRVKTIPRDDAVWSRDIYPNIETFVCDVRRLLRGASSDVALQSRVLAALNDETQSAAPVARPSRASSCGPPPRKQKSVVVTQGSKTPPTVPVKQLDAATRKKKPAAVQKPTPVAFLPPEYKPPPPVVKKPAAVSVGYNTRSKKRQHGE